MKTKIIISIVLLFLVTKVSAQQNAVQYLYDNAGNRIQRNIIVLLGKAPSILQQESEAVAVPSTETIAGITFKIYPNPTEGLVIIQSDENFSLLENKTVVVYDMNGKIVLEKQFNNLEERIDLSKEDPGTYFLKISASNGYKAEWNIVKK